MNVEAATLLRSADPGNAEAVFRAAAKAVKAGLEPDALPLLEAGVSRHPRDARLWQLIGLAHRNLEDPAPALAALERAVELAPADTLIAHTHARATLEAGLPATELFEHAHGLAPLDASILLGLAAAQLAEGRIDEAIAGIEAQLAQHPGWILGHATAARLRWLRGERATFLTSFERALQIAPGEIEIWREMIHSLLHAELFEAALSSVARARAAAGESPVFDTLETVATSESGDIAATDKLFARLGPIQHVTVAARYLRHLLRAGRPAEAAAFAEAWRERDPDDLTTPYLSLAWRLTGDPRWEWLEGDERLVGVYDIGDELPDFARLVETLRGLHLDLQRPLEQSVRGGTQTDGPLLARIEPEIRQLRAALVRTVERHVAQLPAASPHHPTLIARRGPIRFSGSWSIRLTGEGFHVNHVHPAGWFSSAFYVTLPEQAMGGPSHAGWLSLGEATELGLDLPPLRLVEPRPGRLVLFPSTMWHGTRPFAEGERMTVAFDVARPPA